MDKFYDAFSRYRKRQFVECAAACSEILEKNPYDQAAWVLKMQSLTAQLMVDDIEAEEEGIADSLLDSETVAQAARPGTSLKTEAGTVNAAGMRPRGTTGRPLSGMVRPATQTARATSLETALKTPRTARSARPVTSQVARTIRLGTASMMTNQGGPFIQLEREEIKTMKPARSHASRQKKRPSSLADKGFSAKLLVKRASIHRNSPPHQPVNNQAREKITTQGRHHGNVTRLNLAKYAATEGIAKPLFLYIYYHENDIRNALDLAVEATKAAQFKDWWWKVALAKCYTTLGLTRDAEQQLRSALKQVPTVEAYLRLANLYVKLDQPLNVLELATAGLQVFPNEVTLSEGIARVLEGLNNIPASVRYYREILNEDSTHVEAIACIAVNYFYCDQPEVALCFYRRLLQMGLYNAELFNNIGLCCYYAQHYDMMVNCFERALSLAEEDTAADIWYNVAHIAIGVADLMLAVQCLRLCLSINSNHAAAYNNLAVLLYKKGQTQEAISYLQAAQPLGSYLHEPFYNQALLAKEAGDLQTSYNVVKNGLKSYPNHAPSLDILSELDKYFQSL